MKERTTDGIKIKFPENHIQASSLGYEVARRSGITREAGKVAVANFLKILKEELVKGKHVTLGEIGEMYTKPQLMTLSVIHDIGNPYLNVIFFKYFVKLKNEIKKRLPTQEQIDAYHKKG